MQIVRERLRRRIESLRHLNRTGTNLCGCQILAILRRSWDDVMDAAPRILAEETNTNLAF